MYLNLKLKLHSDIVTVGSVFDKRVKNTLSQFIFKPMIVEFSEIISLRFTLEKI